ncbi:MAG: hypothetical protein U1F30_15625 [Steroidobacteraceae bacterium]
MPAAGAAGASLAAVASCVPLPPSASASARAPRAKAAWSATQSTQLREARADAGAELCAPVPQQRCDRGRRGLAEELLPREQRGRIGERRRIGVAREQRRMLRQRRCERGPEVGAHARERVRPERLAAQVLERVVQRARRRPRRDGSACVAAS